MKTCPVSIKTITTRVNNLRLPDGIKGVTVDYSKPPHKITSKSIISAINTMRAAEAEGRYTDITNSVL